MNLCGCFFLYIQFVPAVAAHNQSLIGSKLGTPQKLQPLQQQLMKAGKTPTNQPIPITSVSTPTLRTSSVVRSLQPTSSPIRTPSFGQYNYNTPTPTPIVGKCVLCTICLLITFNFICISVTLNFTARQQHGATTPFPIINQSQKGLFEKMIDYLINDGPSSRYGMICKKCYGHNGKQCNDCFSSNILMGHSECNFPFFFCYCHLRLGMVSQEEYEYSAFICAFCKVLNPAKKIRPIAPRLALPEKSSTGETGNKPQPSRLQLPSSSAPVTDKDSGKLKSQLHTFDIVCSCVFVHIHTGSESDVVTTELRNRKGTPAPESNVNEAIKSEEISQAIEDGKEDDVEEVQEIERSEMNDDKDTAPSESGKTHIDKKNE